MESRQLHKGNVMDMQLSKDGTHFITASTDMTAKLVDTESLEVMKTYPFERPCNSAAISPLYDHVSHSRFHARPLSARLSSCTAFLVEGSFLRLCKESLFGGVLLVK